MTNQETFNRFHDAVNSGDLEAVCTAIDEVADPGLVFHTPVPNDLTGVQTLKQVWVTLLRAFPDIHVAIEDVIAQGDKVVYRNTVTGTHQGEYRGLRPTGRYITYDEIFILRFERGRIAEIWGVVDVFAQLRQLQEEAPLKA
jgi:predicted ester cyclase